VNFNPNAAVYPPKKIMMVTTGLLTTFDDDELTLILCHERAHVILKHWDKQFWTSQGIGMGFRVLNVFVPGAGLANLIAQPVAMRAYSRSQEIDADLEAIKMGKKMGIPATVYIDVLTKLKDHYAVNEESDRTSILDTHPNLSARIARINEEEARPEP
jgi:Zn-dependent protease with chaperone function